MWTVLTKCVLSISLRNFSKRLVLPCSLGFKTHLKSNDDLVAFTVLPNLVEIILFLCVQSYSRIKQNYILRCKVSLFYYIKSWRPWFARHYLGTRSLLEKTEDLFNLIYYHPSPASKYGHHLNQ